MSFTISNLDVLIKIRHSKNPFATKSMSIHEYTHLEIQVCFFISSKYILKLKFNVILLIFTLLKLRPNAYSLLNIDQMESLISLNIVIDVGTKQTTKYYLIENKIKIVCNTNNVVKTYQI